MNIGLIFDMDGVIVNNNKYHFLAWQKLGEKYNKPITLKNYRENMNGRTLFELMKYIFTEPMDAKEIRAIGEEKEAIYREFYKEHRSPMTGLIDFLEKAKKENIPMVVGTSAPKENVVFTLDGLNIRHYFKAVLDESSVTKGKPDPEIYLKCAKSIGLNNSKCVVFEDALSGIKAGKAAGSKVIGLATSHLREELDADLIIDDFQNLDLQTITNLINS